MKKITLLLALLTFSLGANAQVIFSEDFEGEPIIPTGWTTENESLLGDATHVWTIDNTGEAYYFGVGNTYMYDEGLAGNYAIFNSDAYGGGQATASLTSPAFDCSAGGAIKLSFNAWFTSGYGATAKVEASADGGSTWTVVEEYAASNDYGAKLFDITSIVGTSATAHVKFTYAGDYAYYYAVDNITVQIPTVSAPDAVTNLMPADGAVDVPIILSSSGTSKMIDVTFAAATTGDPADRYDWYGGTDPDDLTLSLTDYDGTAAEDTGVVWGSTTAAGWQPSTTYYWKVHAVNIAGETPTPVVSFTTAATDPLSNNKNAFENISLYPNPTTGIMTLSGVDMNSLSDIEITNQLGQQVMNITPSKLDANTLNIRNLNKGIYFVQVTNNMDKSKTFKVIKK